MTSLLPKNSITMALTLVALTLDGSAIFAASSSGVGYQSKLDTAGSASNRYLSGTLAYGNKYVCQSGLDAADQQRCQQSIVFVFGLYESFAPHQQPQSRAWGRLGISYEYRCG